MTRTPLANILTVAALSVVLWGLSGLDTANRALAENREPLLMPGKNTLFQRVLTRPGAVLVETPGAAGGEVQPAMSQYYVYERRDDAGLEWLLVGEDSHGNTRGWIDSSATLPWKQQLALAFTNPANRGRTLFFDSRESVLDLVNREAPEVAVAPIREAVESGKNHPEVVSIEPEEYIDISENFYLLPILQAEEVVTHRGNLRVLEVASVTAKGEDDPLTEKGPETKPKRIAALRTFTATIVFVIDSTISMGPYIERTKEAVRRVYDRVESEGLLDQVKFGLVAYRSSTEAVPGLEYVAQVYADPTKVKDGPDFLAKVAELKPATVSSARFDEDAYAGVMTAIQSVDWSEFGGRYLVLVTDAGALDPENELSSTGLGANEVRIEAEQLGIALYTMHLKTPNGRGNHGSAERQYKTLTRNAIVGRPLYYSVEGGDVETFGTIVDRLGADMVQQVRAASRGELAAGTARVADSDTPADPTEEPADLQEQVSSDAALLGHAMQLAYLGRVQGARAPDLFQAWLTDRDFENPERATTEVRVLLTKNQLSDMRDVVRTILDTGEEAQDQVGTADFFDLLRSSAAHLARDPNQLNRQDATRLGELGLLGEYLDDLPYRSDVMNLTSDIWEEWGATEQEDFLDHLRRKIRHYQIYHDDGARWVALSPTADPGEHVYPVPIEALP